ncbi:MAG: apolipoprotein N-acyltransferase [Pseudorhodoplanes sp.]
MKTARIAHAVVLAWGWKRHAVAFAAGAISVLALAPFNLWPLLFLTFPILVWLIDGSAAGRLGGALAAAAAGWWFGFGYFLAGLYWIGNAFLVDAKTFGWLLPFAVSALPAGLAIFTALGTLAARLLWVGGPARILLLAVCLTASEWLRGNLLTGFPWNAFGYALTGPLPLAQGAAILGLWGMTLLAVAIFAAPATLADESATPRRRYLPLVCAIVTLAVMALFGSIRLARTPTNFVDNMQLRIVQPNLQQDEKFNYALRQKVMAHYLSLSARPGGDGTSSMRGVTHLIWPESAFPFFLSREPGALAQIADILPQNAVLITGGIRPSDDPSRSGAIRAYNSIYVVSHNGSILQVYDKVHLVPFGEYLPFQNFLEKLGFLQLTKVRGGFLSGDRHRTYTLSNTPRFLPLICYEIIFPGAVVPQGERPQWIINITNDGWFGISTGPFQHMQQARVRAIEEGLPLVRSANTGISAVVDPVGRIVASLPLGQEGVLDAKLPRSIDAPFYARYGNGAALLLGGLALVLALRRRLVS